MLTLIDFWNLFNFWLNLLTLLSSISTSKCFRSCPWRRMIPHSEMAMTWMLLLINAFSAQFPIMFDFEQSRSVFHMTAIVDICGQIACLQEPSYKTSFLLVFSTPFYLLKSHTIGGHCWFFTEVICLGILLLFLYYDTNYPTWIYSNRGW